MYDTKKSIVRYLYSFLLFIFIVYQIKSNIDKSITTHYTIKYNLILYIIYVYFFRKSNYQNVFYVI